MKMKRTWARLILTITLVFCLLSPAVFSQQRPQAPSTQPPPSFPAALPKTPVANPASQDAEQRPLHGLQGVLVQTLDGRIVATQNADQPFNPASAVKLVTSLIALRTFGPQHRFATGIWTDGTVSNTAGTLEGNLYISGRDPSLHSEHAIDIAQQLNKLGIRTVNGNLVVAPGFTLNFSWSAQRSGELLYDTFDSQLRSSEAARGWMTARVASGDTSLTAMPSVTITGEVMVEPVAAHSRLLVLHSSSKLVDILKVLLCYSNNFMAERIGDSLGGVQSVQRQITALLGMQPDEIRLSSVSGLGVNRMTPEVMMKVLRALRTELQKNGLTLSDIMPVAGIDPGTLEDRFTSGAWRGSVIAKTGTLVRTDGGASSLVGQMMTLSGQILLFVIMNQYGSVLRFRENQDSFIMQIQNSRGGPRAFDYVPLTMAIKLTDTKNKISDSDEYEPKVTVTSSTP